MHAVVLIAMAMCAQACQSKLEMGQQIAQALQGLLDEQQIQLSREDKAQFILVARDWAALQEAIGLAAAAQPAVAEQCDKQLRAGVAGMLLCVLQDWHALSVILA